MDFAVPADHRFLKKSEKRDKYQDFTRELKKLWKKNGGNTNGNWCSLNNPLRIGKRTGGLENEKTSEDNSDYSPKIGQNTEKSPGDLRKLAPVKDHQLTMLWKTLKK